MPRARSRVRPAALTAELARLGEETEARWRRADYADAAFPRIATEVLSGPRVPLIDSWEVLEWCARAASLPAQTDPGSHFGDLSLTLWAGARFHLAAYFWLDGSTSVHQHQFCGAFRVLAGSSFHSRYRFHESARVSAHVRTGRLVVEDVELLDRGAVRAIPGGDRLIHALFHLDRPSVTLCLRTDSDPDAGPQWSYMWPGLALDPFFVDPLQQKLEQALGIVLETGGSRADGYVRAVLRRADLQTTEMVLRVLFERRRREMAAFIPALARRRDRFARALAVARARHGRRADLVARALEEQERLGELVQRRAQITSAEHRFLLALLMNVPDRARVLAMVAQRYPGRDPAERVAGWVEELAGTRLIGSLEPNVLNIAEPSPEYFAVLQGLLAGRSESAIAAALARRFRGAKGLGAEVRRLARAIRASAPFRGVLGRGP